MNLDFNLAQLSAEQLLELVRQLIAENAQLRAEIEELKRKIFAVECVSESVSK